MTLKQCTIFAAVFGLLVPALGFAKELLVGQPAPDFVVTTFG